MTTDGLTEKLKELLMQCDCHSPIIQDLFTLAQNHRIVLSPQIAEIIAQQLAPEIGKMMPRWIPVSERLPNEGQMVDVWHDNIRYENMFFSVFNGNGCFSSLDILNVKFVSDKKTTHWTPIMKGPMG